MSNMMAMKTYDLAKITRLLLEMRDDCQQTEGAVYDDPKRKETCEALNAAIDLINNPSLLSDVKGDLISREAAKEAVKYIPWCDWLAVGRALDELPAVDAVPVVHGRWVSDESDVLFHCSECEAQIESSWNYEESWKYCPNCGAKMDEEV